MCKLRVYIKIEHDMLRAGSACVQSDHDTYFNLYPKCRIMICICGSLLDNG